MRLWFAPPLFGAWCCLFVSPAAAEEHRAFDVALSVSFDGKCLDHISLSSAVAQWLGGKPVDSELTVLVQGGDKPTPHARFELRRLDEAIAVRQFEGLKGGCDDLQKALPFAIAIAIDARVAHARDASLPVPSARPEVHPDASAISVSKAEPSPPVEEKEPEQMNVQVAAAPAVAQFEPEPTARAFQLNLQTLWLRAVVPQAAWAAQLGLSWRAFDWLDVELGALASLPDAATLAVGQARSTVTGTVVQACARHVSAVLARGCIGGAAGVVRAEGAGYAENLSNTGTWWSGVGGVDVAWPPRTRLAVRISGQILPAVRRPALAVTDTNGGEVGRLQAPKVGAIVALGLSLAL